MYFNNRSRTFPVSWPFLFSSSKLCNMPYSCM